MLCLIQNLLKITIFSVVIDRKRNEKIECIRGIKWLHLASTLVGKWGKEFWICSVSKTGRRRTASHQIGSYAILCSFRKTGERLGGWILKIVSDLQKKKETANSRKISDAPPSWMLTSYLLYHSLSPYMHLYIFSKPFEIELQMWSKSENDTEEMLSSNQQTSRFHQPSLESIEDQPSPLVITSL